MNNLNETTPLIRVSDAIYIFEDGKQEGPFTRQQVGAMRAAASVSDASLAWREGMPDWAPLNTILHPSIEPDPTLAPPHNDRSDCNAVDHEQREVKALPHHRQRDARKATESGGVKFLPSAAHPSKPNQRTENREINAKIAQPSANSSRTEQTEGLSVRRYLLIQLCSGIGVELIAILLMGVLPSDVLAAGITGALALCIVQMSLFLTWWFYTKKLSTVESKNTSRSFANRREPTGVHIQEAANQGATGK